MADVLECITKLANAGQITRAVADEAAEFFKRSKAEWSREMGPASADAAAALETAKKMRDKAAQNQIAIAADVKRWQTIEKRIVEDPRGRNAALAGALSKDTLIGDNRLRELRRIDPDHPIFSDGNADYKGAVVKDKLYSMLGPEMEKFKAGITKGKQFLLSSAKDFIAERFGVDTGNAAAKNVSDAFGKVIDYAAARAKAAGKVFNEIEDWRVMQHWEPSRVANVSEAQYVQDHMAEVTAGGLKLFDKETNRYATAARYEDILKKAYSDIKNEGGRDGPFSKEGRTFEFQPGQAGADSWLRLQGKYGVGNEVMAAVTNHIDHMARTIALHETFGAHPDAIFAAALRLVKDDPSVPVKGFGFMTSENTLQNTYNQVAGRGHPTANETFARIMAGARDLVGIASLRNLPITIIPGDTAMTLLASSHSGMSGFNVLGHVFDGTVTKEVARHMQIAAHGYMDYINNFVRRYEDQINVSGLVRRVSRGVVRATGADWWTTNGRLGFQVSRLNEMARFRDTPFDRLDPAFRDNFLGSYGFTVADWDKIRAPEPFEASNGAKYLDTTKLEQPMAERVLAAIKEQGSYAFHQPDARTAAIMRGGAVRGTLSGEAWLSMGQYKQFVMERMTTHLMRVLVDGPLENRIMRGIAFTALSMGAGAVSLQAAAVVAGKDPIDMSSPKFWLEAFARGGAGGIYGDILSAALHGERGGLNMTAQMAGPIPGFIGDVASLAVNPARREFDEHGRSRRTWGSDVSLFSQRWSPNTWYTKLAVDRMLWDKLQMTIDPDYRASFRRADANAKKQGTGFWWARGETGPARPPNPGNVLGH
jgi:hypothetical protein